MAPAGTGMAPAIAIAAGDRVSLVEWETGSDRVVQQLRGLCGFVV